jgi:EamA domain-containing membrane protein RarD
LMSSTALKWGAFPLYKYAVAQACSGKQINNQLITSISQIFLYLILTKSTKTTQTGKK